MVHFERLTAVAFVAAYSPSFSSVLAFEEVADRTGCAADLPHALALCELVYWLFVCNVSHSHY